MDNNEIQVGSKLDTKSRLRKVMFPMGLGTSIIFVCWMILHLIGASSTDFKFTEDMLDASRYIAIAAIFLAFVVAGLMIAHSVLQLIKIRGDNVKQDLTAGIINALVGLLMLIFFIVLATKVFNEEKWCYDEAGLRYYSAPYGSNTYEVFAMMGIMLVLLVLCTIFAYECDRNKRIQNNSNAIMFRTIGLTAFILSLVAVAPIVFGAACGMKNMENFYNTSGAEYTTSHTRTNWIAGGMAIKFSYGIIGSIALLMLTLIPLSILSVQSKDEQVKAIVLWSVLGGVSIIVFAIAASMMKINKTEGYTDLYISKWFTKTVTCSIFALIAMCLGVACGTVSFIKSNKFLKQKPTPTAAAIQA